MYAYLYTHTHTHRYIHIYIFIYYYAHVRSLHTHSNPNLCPNLVLPVQQHLYKWYYIMPQILGIFTYVYTTAHAHTQIYTYLYLLIWLCTYSFVAHIIKSKYLSKFRVTCTATFVKMALHNASNTWKHVNKMCKTHASSSRSRLFVFLDFVWILERLKYVHVGMNFLKYLSFEKYSNCKICATNADYLARTSAIKWICDELRALFARRTANVHTRICKWAYIHGYIWICMYVNMNAFATY